MLPIQLILVLFLTSEAHSNIVFTRARLLCDPKVPPGTRCLRGQICNRYGFCVPRRTHPENKPWPIKVELDTISRTSFANEKGKDSLRQLLTDTVIGPLEFNLIDGKNGLICTDSQNQADPECRNSPKLLKVGSRDNSSWFERLKEPVLRPAPSKPPSKKRPVGTTTDGYCGSRHGDLLCGNDWPNGSCCSVYGLCGNTTSHCGYGCQSGPCLDERYIDPPTPPSYTPRQLPGSFEIVGRSGIPPMAAALLPNGRVMFADKVENYTELPLPNGRYAYSAEFDPEGGTLFPLSFKTNAFCSGGTFLADGRVLSVGGNDPFNSMDPTVGDGFKGIRYLERHFDEYKAEGAHWIEPGHSLASRRWYPSVQTLSDGRVFVVSGSLNGDDPSIVKNNNPTYELLDEYGIPEGMNIEMSILERNQPHYMYPFLHLLNDGSLFIFVSRSAEVFDVEEGVTVSQLPELPGDFRTYPNSGGSVMLPLRSSDDWDPEIMVCGGSAYQDIESPSDHTCGRIRPLANKPKWKMESMPGGRVMGEAVLLPDGSVLWINGCSSGAQGYGVAKDPIYEPWIYRRWTSQKKRWAIGGTSEIPRMYHSVALLLLDGSVLVAGSNPVEEPLLTADPRDPKLAFASEFRVEIYTPHYLMDGNDKKRPHKLTLSTRYLHADGSTFWIGFENGHSARNLEVVLYHGGFVTHSVHMGHRMLYLDHSGWRSRRTKQNIEVTCPPDSNVAPPGPYVIYAVVDGIPSEGQFVMVN